MLRISSCPAHAPQRARSVTYGAMLEVRFWLGSALIFSKIHVSLNPRVSSTRKALRDPGDLANAVDHKWVDGALEFSCAMNRFRLWALFFGCLYGWRLSTHRTQISLSHAFPVLKPHLAPKSLCPNLRP